MGAAVINVRSYGAQCDAATDDSDAFDRAIAAALAAPYGAIVLQPEGESVITRPLHTIDKPNVSVHGAGADRSRLQYNGTGDCLRVKLASFVSTKAGAIRGLTINGTPSAAGAAVHMGDIIGFGFEDVVLQAFTHASGNGLWVDNTAQFTERSWARGLTLYNNTKSLRFTVNGGTDSHAYNKWMDLRLGVENGQTGISAEGSSLVLANDWFVNANVNGNTGNTASVITLAGTAQINYGHGSFLMEQSSGDSAKWLTCPANTWFAGDYYVEHGTLGRSAGGVIAAGTAVPTVTLNANGALTIDAGLTAGSRHEVFQVALNANATSTTVTNPAYGQILTLAIINSGTFTMAWPANFLFAGGTAPAQPSAGNRTLVTMYSDGSNWFEMARAVNVG